MADTIHKLCHAKLQMEESMRAQKLEYPSLVCDLMHVDDDLNGRKRAGNDFKK